MAGGTLPMRERLHAKPLVDKHREHNPVSLPTRKGKNSVQI
jgi:hypothetical protein